jgi:hypothetical protein
LKEDIIRRLFDHATQNWVDKSGFVRPVNELAVIIQTHTTN